MNTEYRKNLFKAMASRGYNQGQCDYILNSLDTAIQGGETTEKIFNSLLSTFDGDINAAIANYQSNAGTIRYNNLSQTAQELETALERANNARVETNPFVRLKEAAYNAAKNFNSNIKKCSITICGQATGGQVLEVLSDEEKFALEQIIPHRENKDKSLYEAWGSLKVHLNL